MGPPITFPPLYKSYDEQQYTELLRLFDILVNLEEPILLGDFNHGPALPGNITWELPFHYGLMTSRGLVSPYVNLDGRCTWCGSQENVAAASFPFDEVIDHIYILTESLGRVKYVEVNNNSNNNNSSSLILHALIHSICVLFFSEYLMVSPHQVVSPYQTTMEYK